MRNPIFNADTKFLDHIDGCKIRYVSGEQTKILSSGVKIMRLETVQPLVEVRTAAGFILTIAPETAFSLAKSNDGKLVRFTPIDYPTSDEQRPIDWQAPLTDLDSMHYRKMVLVGLVLASGVHSFNRQRASYFVLDDLDSSLEIASFLTRVAEKWYAEGAIHFHAMKVSHIETPNGNWMVRGRVLTTLIGGMLSEHTQTPTFDLSGVENFLMRALYRGIFMACHRHNDDVIIRHRNAYVVRTLAEHLSYRFGVTSSISIHPMEPLIQKSISVPEGHHIRLSAEQLNRAAMAGLTRGGPEFDVQQFTTDTIEKITPLKERLNSVIVLPGQGSPPILTANGFVFHPEFDIPTGITEIASHPALLGDSSDPTLF